MKNRDSYLALNKHLCTVVHIECIVHYQVYTQLYKPFLRQFPNNIVSVLCRRWSPPVAARIYSRTQDREIFPSIPLFNRPCLFQMDPNDIQSRHALQ